jgi:hypothetical protein
MLYWTESKHGDIVQVLRTAGLLRKSKRPQRIFVQGHFRVDAHLLHSLEPTFDPRSAAYAPSGYRRLESQ